MPKDSILVITNLKYKPEILDSFIDSFLWSFLFLMWCYPFEFFSWSPG